MKQRTSEIRTAKLSIRNLLSYKMLIFIFDTMLSLDKPRWQAISHSASLGVKLSERIFLPSFLKFRILQFSNLHVFRLHAQFAPATRKSNEQDSYFSSSSPINFTYSSRDPTNCNFPNLNSEQIALPNFSFMMASPVPLSKVEI